MKEQIYTIPVLEALKKNNECAFCDMLDKLDADAVNFTLSPAYMEPDVRTVTNRTGFCPEHYKKLYYGQNRLGLALITQTHLMQLTSELKKRSVGKKPTGIGAALDKAFCSCYVCDRVSETFERYVDTFLHLWKRSNSEIRELVVNGRGYCLQHFAVLTKAAEKSSEYKSLMDVLLPLQIKRFSELQEDIDWFINKFDYRYKDEPWKNAKDSLIRMMKKIGSADVGE